MKRGDMVTVALSGDFGKPRPSVIIQSDTYNPTHSTVIVCPITSTLEAAPLFRLTLDPSPTNGLRKISQVMIDKPHTVHRERLGEYIGQLDTEQIVRLNRSLMVFLGLP